MNHPATVAIETSSRVGSVALARGPALLGERQFSTQTEHARELIPTLMALQEEVACETDEIEHCYLSIGPGSFTGLRVAVTFARHLALARGVRLVAVPTLTVIAQNCAALTPPPSPLVVILDAKRGQVFGAIFDHGPAGGYLPRAEPFLLAPRTLLASAGSPVWVTGEGVTYHRDAIDEAGAEVVPEQCWMPRAALVHRVGLEMALRHAFTQPRDLIPKYLRRPEAEELWEKRHGQGSTA